MNKDLYVIKKLIMAENIEEAIKKEKSAKIADIWMDEEWKKDKIVKSNKLGFK